MNSPVRTCFEPRATASKARAGLLQAASVWMQVSMAGIGGPALQIATMHRLLVQGRRWISEERFFHALSYCIAMPGPETQQLATYIGWLSHRMKGGMLAGGLFILPGAICMMALCFGYVTGAESGIGQAVFIGVKPAILAIMIEAILRLRRAVLPTPGMVAIALLAFSAAFFKVAFAGIVLVAALLGFCAAIAGLPGFVRAARGPTDNLTAARDEERPDHSRPGMVRFARSLAICLGLWFAPVVVLLALAGPASVYTQISLLFSKVALMAIGGDYAVVAYAAREVVESYHWITAREMQEGIALGEMVPGTIMIVTQFLGFVAAYRDPGLLPPLLGAVLGGLLATWMTFAPCFLWIFAVAPYIEGLRKNAFLDGPLRAVTAAAVGMIGNLSFWFGIRALFGHVAPVQHGWLAFDAPSFASLDLRAVGLFVLAAFAVLRFKTSAAATLITCSAIGILLFYFGIAGVRA